MSKMKYDFTSPVYMGATKVKQYMLTGMFDNEGCFKFRSKLSIAEALAILDMAKELICDMPIIEKNIPDCQNVLESSKNE